jgi:hypothetical protein
VDGLVVLDEVSDEESEPESEDEDEGDDGEGGTPLYEPAWLERDV